MREREKGGGKGGIDGEREPEREKFTSAVCFKN